MEHQYVLSKKEICSLINSIRQINHDIHCIEQNINNPEIIKKYVDLISECAVGALKILED